MSFFFEPSPGVEPPHPSLESGEAVFGAFDEWVFVVHPDEKLCEDCRTREGVYRGEDLTLQFPFLLEVDWNTVEPRVHIHCRCTLIRMQGVRRWSHFVSYFGIEF